MEEAELREMVRHTLANDKGKAYHHLIEACLGQTMNLSQGSNSKDNLDIGHRMILASHFWGILIILKLA